MASNSFGNVFRITTWGESHGKAIGVVIDGCLPGLHLSEEDINQALIQRAPGNSPYTSPRKEPDLASIYSGTFQGLTTAAPISIIIKNKDADSSKYENIKHILRPGHANYTYLKKYGLFDYRGGGRASARETACRVAAGAVAQKILDLKAIEVCVFIKSIGAIEGLITEDFSNITKSPISALDANVEPKMLSELERVISDGDSIGGKVGFFVKNLPVGLGDPIFEKLEANLAKAMMSIPASKCFEIGQGINCSSMQGSEHNDSFDPNYTSNNAGGTLGGISTGMPLWGTVAFKPTSSIKKNQRSLDLSGKSVDFSLPKGSRHDPCLAIRAVPVVKAMCQLVIADAILMQNIIS